MTLPSSKQISVCDQQVAAVESTFVDLGVPDDQDSARAFVLCITDRNLGTNRLTVGQVAEQVCKDAADVGKWLRQTASLPWVGRAVLDWLVRLASKWPIAIPVDARHADGSECGRFVVYFKGRVRDMLSTLKAELGEPLSLCLTWDPQFPILVPLGDKKKKSYDIDMQNATTRKQFIFHLPLKRKILQVTINHAVQPCPLQKQIAQLTEKLTEKKTSR